MAKGFRATALAHSSFVIRHSSFLSGKLFFPSRRNQCILRQRMKPPVPSGRRCPGLTRRSFLADTGMGFTGLALGAMLFRDGVAQADSTAAWRPPDGLAHFTPKAKSVIWIF